MNQALVTVIPTYNEIDNIRRLVPHLLEMDIAGWTMHVCVVDDDSPDGTGAWVGHLAETSTNVHVIRRMGERGLGTAYLAGLRYALEVGADAVMTMDADFSHHPRYIPELLLRADAAEVIIGSRYITGGRALFPFHRRILSRCANAVAHSVLRIGARDATAGFRVYRHQALRSIDLDAIRSNGYSFLLEILFMIEETGARIVEVPIIFADREMGQSKIAPREILRAGLTCGRLLFRRLKAGVSRTSMGTP